ncbi:MAG: helix-turn-helix domain-containing protein [Lachnospiraceae bacterium]
MLKEVMNMKDAVELVGVEAHVLRYWEEELVLPIQRSEKGRRYYLQSDIDTFLNIKEWKGQGMSLKAIRDRLSEDEDEFYGFKGLHIVRHINSDKETEIVTKSEAIENMDKAQRLQLLLKQFIQESMQSSMQEAMIEGNKMLVSEMKESLVKEMDYQFRAQEEREVVKERARIEREEQHYKQIDELLRIVSIKGKGKRKKHSIF